MGGLHDGELKMDNELLEKMRRYCAYQERAMSEVRLKMYQLKIPSKTIEEVIKILVEEDFIDEERFTEAYVRGKFRIKQWGRLKIRQQLQQKGIAQQLIDKHLKNDIDEKEYQKTLQEQLLKYLKINTINTEADRAKLLRHFMAKGYEYDNIINHL